MSEEPLPEDVTAEAEALTRRARTAGSEAEADAYREDRAALLADYDYTARVREEDEREVLVLYPAEWVEDGTVRTDRIEDVDRGLERPLSGPGDADWEDVEAHNRAIAEAVAAAHGEVHGANAHALADFLGNHYLKPLEDATAGELEEFLEEYYPRNAFATAEERAVVAESVRLAYAETGREPPLSA